MFVVCLVMGQVNKPAARSSDESVDVCPLRSTTTVPEPTSNMALVPEPTSNMPLVPEPIEPLQNMSIPAAAVKSTIASDELGGLFVDIIIIIIMKIFGSQTITSTVMLSVTAFV